MFKSFLKIVYISSIFKHITIEADVSGKNWCQDF